MSIIKLVGQLTPASLGERYFLRNVTSNFTKWVGQSGMEVADPSAAFGDLEYRKKKTPHYQSKEPCFVRKLERFLW